MTESVALERKTRETVRGACGVRIYDGPLSASTHAFHGGYGVITIDRHPRRDVDATGALPQEAG